MGCTLIVDLTRRATITSHVLTALLEGLPRYDQMIDIPRDLTADMRILHQYMAVVLWMIQPVPIRRDLKIPMPQQVQGLGGQQALLQVL